MKKLLRNSSLLLILFYSTTSCGQNKQLTKLWETPADLKVPESVLYYPEEKVLFVSDIDGDPGAKDKKGSIARLGLDGKILNAEWATDLSAPKGMGIHGQSLYVADVDEVVVLDLKTGKVTRRIPVSGAGFLNDITISNAGVVYVSDSKTGKIHRIENDTAGTFLENQAGVNGLLAVGGDLYLLRKGELWKADKEKKLTKIASGMDESTDGIEQTASKDFIVSCWNGVVYYVKADGHKEQLLDTRPEKLSSADIGFDAQNNIIYVPTFNGNKVVAYQLK